MSRLKYQYFLLFGILAVSGMLMLGAARGDSLIMDELPHIPAGYSYVAHLDYRLNPEHPPLVKALAAVPLLFVNVNFPDTVKSWTEDVNGQWDFGREFFYRAGNDAHEITFLSRIFPILLALLAGAVVYFWAKERMGKTWALLPAFLFLFSPTVLAHGHYVTTDIGAALGTLITLFSFVSFLEKPSPARLVIAGVALGLAELMKFSNAMLFPFLGVLAGIYWLSGILRRSPNEYSVRRGWLRIFFSYAAVCLIAFGVIYAAYAAFTWNYPIERQVSDTTQILQSFSNRGIADAVQWMSGNPVFRPLAQYFLGVIMVAQRSSGGNTGYFVGELSSTGWWFYFPLVFLTKEMFPALLIIFSGAFRGVVGIFRNRIGSWWRKMLEYLGTNFHEFSMLLFILLYWAWSMRSPLNIGVRHLLPVLPLMYILGAGAVKKIFAETMAPGRIKGAILTILLAWMAAGSFLSYPFFLSYFNEASGGVFRGYRIATDSNYDWGQDLSRLGEWVSEKQQNGEVQKIAVDYFGGGDPAYELGESAVPWNSAMGNPRESGIEWIAVSVNTLSQAFAKTAPGFERKDSDEYGFLRELNPEFKEGAYGAPEPYARAGTSIFIYRLGE